MGALCVWFVLSLHISGVRLAEPPGDPPGQNLTQQTGEADQNNPQNPAANSTAGPSVTANQQQILEDFVARMQTVTPTPTLTSHFPQDTNRADGLAGQLGLSCHA